MYWDIPWRMNLGSCCSASMGRSRMQCDNYVTKIAAMQDAGTLPRVGVAQIEVFHDDWCGVFQSQRCDCDPEVRLKYALPDAVKN
jgi:hypothetical protein